MNTDPPISEGVQASLDLAPVDASADRPHAMSYSAIAFAMVSVPLVFMCAPGLTTMDAGELLAASTELGIAHPPGLALFCLLHKTVTFLLPFGDIAFRGNLASGLLGALAAAWSVRVAIRLGAHPWCATLAATLALTSPVFLLHSVTVEVYSGVVLLCLVALELVLLGRHKKDRRYWALAAFVLGLCIGGHHGELRILALLMMATILLSHRDVRVWSVCAVSGVFGSLVTLYLPIRAQTQPWRNWGDPSTMDAWLSHFWADRIRQAYGDQMGQVDAQVNLQFFDQMVLMQWPLVLLGLLGVLLAARTPWGWLLFTVGTLDVLYSIFLNPMGVRDLQNGMLLTGVLVVGAGITLSYAWQLTDRVGARTRLIIAATGICALGCTVAIHSADRDLSSDRSLPELLTLTEDRLVPETLLLTASDDFSAGWAYRQVVEGARPDVAVVVRQHVAYASSVGPVARRLPNALKGWAPGASLRGLAHLQPTQSEDTSWPVAWEWAGGIDGAERPRALTPVFPVYLTTEPPTASDARTYFAHLQRWFSEHSHRKTRLASQLAGDLSQYLMGKGGLSQAMDVAVWATEVAPESVSRWIQLGVTCSALSGHIRQQCASPTLDSTTRSQCDHRWRTLMERAIIATERALELNPDQGTARTNLVRYLINLERHEDARLMIDEYQGDMASEDGFAFRALIAANQGKLKEAREHSTRALEAHSGQSDAQDLLLQMARRDRMNAQFADAQQSLDILKALAPSPSVYTEEGILFLQQEEEKKALDSLERALALDPHFTKAHMVITSIRLRGLLFLKPIGDEQAR